MSDLPESPDARALLSPRKLIMQLLGFAVGLALLLWIVINAIREGQWDRIGNARPILVAALLGCTMISTLINGATFWITIQSIRRVRLWDMQRLNVVANMLNYAPVRLGALARVLYHVRVDRLSLLQVGAWFALIGYILVLGVASCFVATMARDRVDGIWALLVAGQMLLGVMVIRVIAGQPFVVRYGRGIDRLISDSRGLWSAVAARVVDLAAYVGRMAVAAAILDIQLTGSQVVVLAMVALAASLIPFGRFGFREFCVAAAGQRLNMLASDVEANMNQLALVESAGEVLVFLPLGLIFLPWFRRRWREATNNTEEEGK